MNDLVLLEFILGFSSKMQIMFVISNLVVSSNQTKPSVFINLNPEPQVLLFAPAGVLIKNPPPVKS